MYAILSLLILASTAERHYDANGRLIGTSERTASYSSLFSETIREYDRQGRYLGRKDTKCTEVSCVTRRYDRDGRLIGTTVTH